jgi:hypothetical protein
MSANPFDQFDSPTAAPSTAAPSTAAAPTTKSKGNPFDQFDAPSAVSPSATAQASASGDQGPDYFSVENQLGPFAPLFGYKPSYPIDTPSSMLQHLANIGRVGANTFAFNAPDKLLGTGAGTEEAQQRLNKTVYAGAGTTAGLVGQMLVGNEVGAGRTLAAGLSPYLPSFLARGIGGAAEQGGIAAAGALGQGQNPLDMQTGISAILGGVFGPFAKENSLSALTAEPRSLTERVLPAKPGSIAAGTQAGASAATPVVTSDLETAKNTAYDTLKNLPVAPRDVNLGINDALATLTPGERSGLSPGFVGQIRRVRGQNSGDITADDVDSFARNIRDGANTGPDRIAAARIAENLQGRIYPAEQAAARQAQGQFAGVQRMDEWQQQAATPGGPSVAQQAGQWLRTGQGQQFAPPGSEAYKAVSAVGGMGDTPTSLSDLWPSLWDTRHIARPMIEGAIAGPLLGRSTDPTTIAEEALVGGLTGYGLHKLGPLAFSPFARARQAAVTGAARQTLGTDAPFKIGSPQRDKVMQALRYLMATQGAQGR